MKWDDLGREFCKGWKERIKGKEVGRKGPSHLTRPKEGQRHHGKKEGRWVGLGADLKRKLSQERTTMHLRAKRSWREKV